MLLSKIQKKKNKVSSCQWVYAPLTTFLAVIIKAESWGEMSQGPSLLSFVNHTACLQTQNTSVDLVTGLETLP